LVVRVGIIGSGMIGATVARLCVPAGHDVAVANRHHPDTLQALVEELGPGMRSASVEEAAAFGDVIVIAIPFWASDQLPAAAFAGKIVVDAGNYYPKRDGPVPVLDRGELTSTELLARHFVGARVVKGFNTMYYVTLANGGDRTLDNDHRLALYVCGDDADAKQVVAQLIDDLGFAAVDTGGLAEGGRRQQPGSIIYARDLVAADARTALHDGHQ
jgi:8-hydroxy-5-deazaflavin:NADPH oxidoreductase